ncbi:hypothetical protein [Novosphingobium decolorationis]|uniref:Uncharacterized protein n=1 Tax=Novosphingobium decolorationis TaxID=2698673 RepID=A0ABX8E831_9SPHN|nr:hypothetical protein [Novosphingobium decolorationis]QVM85184.1 hypothetical protein HT578_17105 [Novosphingobium decolorationis]
MTSDYRRQIEAELKRRYGSPIVDNTNMAGFALNDGRQIALQRKGAILLWVENAENATDLPVEGISYPAEKGREANLPKRLKHKSTYGWTPIPALAFQISEMDELNSVLEWYERKYGALNHAALERLKAIFLAKHPDFIEFANCPSFEEMEGGYKTALLERAREIMDEFPASNDPAELGGALLDLLLNKTELFSNLIDWRAAKIPEGIRDRHPGLIEQEAGLLALADNAEDSVMRFVENLWEAFREDLTSAPYAESRMIPTMLRGLVDPDGTLGIRSSPTNQAMKALTGQPAFS